MEIVGPRWLPFASMNLLRNPFGELTRHDRVRAAIVDLPRFTKSLDVLGSGRLIALQFLADCGRGKSTNMLAIADCYPTSAYVYLPEDGPCPAIPDGDPLFIDEAQRLSWLKRRSVFRRGVRLVLGTHRDNTSALERAGYHVQTIRVGEDLGSEKLLSMLNRRIELARLGPGDVPAIDVLEAEDLIQRYGSNIRAIEDALFDRFQKMASKNEWQNAIYR